MIHKELMTIISTNRIAEDSIEMVLKNPCISEIAIPGQFLHIRIGEKTLRRPISIADCNREQQTITIIFKINGAGTEELAMYRCGDVLDVLAPVGNGFSIDKESPSTILLVGGGIGVPPLYFLGKTLKDKGYTVVSVLGFQHKASVFYEDEFKALGETIIVTNDGSYGEKGFVTDVLDKVPTFDSYYSCGPIVMLKALSTKLAGKEGYLSLEERMGCGVGACFACVIPTKDGNGYKKICKDGPVFHAEEVSL
ncbi:dihydroorotate dehydrogenase electron transfer subunit [Ornithinibacillus xuwenensis]|uniref:Dihydroorotate dehydrogenase B (NAD(+)), electron transfer subunit n=1 Tax=Ornithinibacillus xuwenensis TaxID=3144668 RepID=A0ABU9XFP2_9BACI